MLTKLDCVVARPGGGVDFVVAVAVKNTFNLSVSVSGVQTCLVDCAQHCLAVAVALSATWAHKGVYNRFKIEVVHKCIAVLTFCNLTADVDVQTSGLVDLCAYLVEAVAADLEAVEAAIAASRMGETHSIGSLPLIEPSETSL